MRKLGRNLNDELYRNELGHIWLNGVWSNLKNICQIIKTSCNYMQRKSNREGEGIKSLVSYRNMKKELGELFIDQRNSNESNTLASFRLGMWKQRGKSKMSRKEGTSYVT